MPVVGTLTVDLVANTATFVADLGKAGNSLDGLGKAAEDAGEHIDVSMRAARGSLMLMGDEFGIHLPREIRTMIAEIPGIGLALESLLPILGVVFAAKMIYEFIEANEKAARELGEAWNKVGITTNDIFAHIGDKLLEVGKKSDELAGNHVAALQKQLALVDRQTMAEIIGELDKMGKEADNVFTKMQGNWFMQLMMGRADTGPAKAELNEMIAEIDRLKGTGADPGNATRALLGTDIDAVGEEITKLEGQLKSFQAQKQAAEEAGNFAVALSINGQVRGAAQRLDLEKQNLATLQQMRDVAAATVTIGQGEKANDKTEEADKEAERQNKLFEVQQRGLEQRRRAEAEYAKKTTETKKKAAEEDEHIAEDELRATTAVMEGQAKIQQALDNESLKQASAMAKLKAAADEQEAKHSLAMHTATAQQAVNAEIKASQERAKIELAALDAESAALMQHGTVDALKLKQIEDKKTQVIKQATNEQTKIREAAEEKQYQDIKRAEERMATVISQNVAKGIVEGKNLAKGFEDMGKQMLESALANTLKMILIGDMKQAKDAGHAAASAFTWVMQDVPFPANAVIAPAAAAAAFAGVMAFEQGGEIPGTGPKPIIGHGGETVVTKALTDRVEEAEGRGKNKRNVTIVQNIHTKDADGFKRSQSQLHSKAFHAANTASRRNK